MNWKNLAEKQKELHFWKLRNFPNSGPLDQLAGMIEEYGELIHAHLKDSQAIRYSKKEALEKKKDAIGDIVVFFSNLCSDLDFQFNSCLKIEGESPDYRSGFEDESARIKKANLDETDIWHFPLSIMTPIDNLRRKLTSLPRNENPVGSGFVFLAAVLIRRLNYYCFFEEIDFEECVDLALKTATARDWIKYPANGRNL